MKLRAILALLLLAGLSAGTLLQFARPEPAEAPPSSLADSEHAAAEVPHADRFGDPLPAGALVRFGTVRYRPGNIEYCALSPDGKTLATTGTAAGITILDLSTGRHVCHLDGSKELGCNPGDPPMICFSPDGNQLAGVVTIADWWGWSEQAFYIERERRLCVWDVRTGREMRRIPLPVNVPFDEKNCGRYMAFGPTGKDVLVLNQRGEACSFDLASGKQRWRRDTGVAGAKDGRAFLAHSADCKILCLLERTTSDAILFVSPETGAEIRRIEVPTTARWRSATAISSYTSTT
jgi:hypothetical protein